MKKLAVLWVAGIGLLSLTVAEGAFRAAEDGEANVVINKVADLLEKGDVAGAKQAAKDVAAKNDVETIMTAFNLRKKKGIGVGSTANDIMPDGIEAKIQALARDGITPAALKKEGPGLARAGYVIAAVGHIAFSKAPAKDIGKQKKSDWIEWSKDLAKASEDFAVAAKGGSAAEVKKTASKVNQTCDSCHAVFK
jgi:Cytochrome C'